MSVFVGYYHLLYNLLNVFVGCFYCAIHFMSIRRRIGMLDFELSAKFGNHSIIEVSPIVYDNPSRDTIAADEVVFDESGYHTLCD